VKRRNYPDDSSPVKAGQEVPVRTCETLSGPGARTKTLRVFCPFRARSFDLEACRRCPRLLVPPDEPEAPGASLLCRPSAPPRAEAHFEAHENSTFAAVAAGIAVGEAMATRVVCVRPEAPLEDAYAHVQGVLLPVVDADGVLLGVLYRPDLTMAPETGTLEVRIRVASRAGVVADRMDARAKALDESSPLVEALHAMTVHRARSLPVLSDGGVVVGTLTDLDVLRWFGLARRRAAGT
jgi:CBS domain-containing protein